MRNLVCLSLLVSLVMVFCPIGKATQDQDESLVLYLPFDEGSGDEVHDASIYGNDGTLQNDPEWVTGEYGSALEFSTGGDMNWVEVPDSDSLDFTDEITMMAWVINKGQPTWGRVIDKNNPYMLAITEADCVGVWFAAEGGPGHLTDAKVPKDKWTHVAGTFDGSEVKLYINGDLEGTTEAVEPMDVSENPLTIGNMTGGAVGNQESGRNERPFFGVIDEVKIYNRALSPGEIGEALKPAAVQPKGKLATFWGRLKCF